MVEAIVADQDVVKENDNSRNLRFPETFPFNVPLDTPTETNSNGGGHAETNSKGFAP
jgi:hypothetical protein